MSSSTLVIEPNAEENLRRKQKNVIEKTHPPMQIDSPSTGQKVVPDLFIVPLPEQKPLSPDGSLDVQMDGLALATQKLLDIEREKQLFHNQLLQANRDRERQQQEILDLQQKFAALQAKYDLLEWNWIKPSGEEISKWKKIDDALADSMGELKFYANMKFRDFDVGEHDTELVRQYKDTDLKEIAVEEKSLALLKKIKKVSRWIGNCRDDLLNAAKAKCLNRNLIILNQFDSVGEAENNLDKAEDNLNRHKKKKRRYKGQK